MMQMFSPSALIIDVRDHDYSLGGCIQNAIHIPHFFPSKIIDRVNSSPFIFIYVYCQCGLNRSVKIANILRQNCFGKEIILVEGGFTQFSDEFRQFVV
ncbi:Rhodanese-like_domain [Hexamita inflata]|uniref:Rhodanese-like domain n=1 Tax=Hexamita inflata TaxID=28002 RepID=A0AA86PJI9_9EUKA|nr:Rhodanese-like domain [Hexamita inflata]